ncbi:TIGR00266 family protein [Amphritea sp.]|uniref:TIGR00266 family protein n=1 Tax=Amphritea sp. TaxID=1872502 RepID=UPI0025C35BC0|nr:TIGR00266 family protein [Amphritea sp.]
MKCHKVDYEIIGNSMPMLEVELDPGETVIAEAGSMNYMEQDIGFETKMGDGADPDQGLFSKMFSAGKRMVTGESLFMTHFSNSGGQKRKVAFAAPYPGMVVPIDMAQVGERLYCQKDAFLCAALGTRLSVAFSRKLGAGFFGGEGFILQKLEGDGMAFIQAGGTVVKKELNNETLRIDTGCLVGFSEGIEYDIEMVKGLKSMFLGGEGLWLATLSGTGTVWVQSLPFSRLADRILAAAPAIGGSDKGES